MKPSAFGDLGLGEVNKPFTLPPVHRHGTYKTGHDLCAGGVSALLELRTLEVSLVLGTESQALVGELLDLPRLLDSEAIPLKPFHALPIQSEVDSPAELLIALVAHRIVDDEGVLKPTKALVDDVFPNERSL